MAEIIKNGDIEKAKVSFTCPACGTEFFEIPVQLNQEATEVNGNDGQVLWTCYRFETECPLCGLTIIRNKAFY